MTDIIRPTRSDCDRLPSYDPSLARVLRSRLVSQLRLARAADGLLALLEECAAVIHDDALSAYEEGFDRDAADALSDLADRARATIAKAKRQGVRS